MVIFPEVLVRGKMEFDITETLNIVLKFCLLI
jgi:hypothetical protein